MYERACVTVFQRDSGREEKACLTKTRQRSPGRVGYESSCVCFAAVQVTEKQAVQCGFKDYPNFYRAFKTRYRLSPRDCVLRSGEF